MDNEKERIAELFKSARQEGSLSKWADGIADMEQVFDVLKEFGYTRQPSPELTLAREVELRAVERQKELEKEYPTKGSAQR